MIKVSKNGRKVKAIALLFSCFFTSFSKIEKSAKNGRKVKAIALFFVVFCLIFQIEKSAKNGRKVKAIALLFCCFFASFSKMKNRLKMDEKHGLTFFWVFFPLMKNEKIR
jgi:hypothetical protein